MKLYKAETTGHYNRRQNSLDSIEQMWGRGKKAVPGLKNNNKGFHKLKRTKRSPKRHPLKSPKPLPTEYKIYKPRKFAVTKPYPSIRHI